MVLLYLIKIYVINYISPIIYSNECKVISSISKSLLIALTLTSIKNGNVDTGPMWCNVYEEIGMGNNEPFTGPVLAKALCTNKEGRTNFFVEGIIDNDNSFDLKENSKVNKATPFFCAFSSATGAIGAFNMGWYFDHQKLTSVSGFKKISAILVAISSPIAGGTCGSLSSNS